MSRISQTNFAVSQNFASHNQSASSSTTGSSKPASQSGASSSIYNANEAARHNAMNKLLQGGAPTVQSNPGLSSRQAPFTQPNLQIPGAQAGRLGAQADKLDRIAGANGQIRDGIALGRNSDSQRGLLNGNARDLGNPDGLGDRISVTNGQGFGGASNRLGQSGLDHPLSGMRAGLQGSSPTMPGQTSAQDLLGNTRYSGDPRQGSDVVGDLMIGSGTVGAGTHAVGVGISVTKAGLAGEGLLSLAKGASAGIVTSSEIAAATGGVAAAFTAGLGAGYLMNKGISAIISSATDGKNNSLGGLIYDAIHKDEETPETGTTNDSGEGSTTSTGNEDNGICTVDASSEPDTPPAEDGDTRPANDDNSHIHKPMTSQEHLALVRENSSRTGVGQPVAGEAPVQFQGEMPQNPTSAPSRHTDWLIQTSGDGSDGSNDGSSQRGELQLTGQRLGNTGIARVIEGEEKIMPGGPLDGERPNSGQPGGDDGTC